MEGKTVHGKLVILKNLEHNLKTLALENKLTYNFYYQLYEIFWGRK